MKNYPLFPLKLFLLPGEFTQLYIFEERYKQLVRDCFAKSKTFGIAYSGKLNLKNLGSLVKIVEITKEHSNGELDIVVQSVGVFVLERFYFKAPEKLYPAGNIRLVETPFSEDLVSPELLKLYRAYFAEKDHPDPELLWQPTLQLVDLLKGLFLSDFEKMDLVQLEDKAAVESYLKNYIRYLQLLEEQEKNVYQNIYLN
ncbi:MAG: hypothetical protein DA405_12230 [Bacteroidetes bacterium]|nr:MAG: hypothetical protein DA405_12230 [Bacteroidota bacterium]